MGLQREPGASGRLPESVQGLGRKRSISRRSSRAAHWRRLPALDRWAPAVRNRPAATKGLRGLGVLTISFIDFSSGERTAVANMELAARKLTARVAGATRAVEGLVPGAPRLASAHRHPGRSTIWNGTMGCFAHHDRQRQEAVAGQQVHETQRNRHGADGGLIGCRIRDRIPRTRQACAYDKHDVIKAQALLLRWAPFELGGRDGLLLALQRRHATLRTQPQRVRVLGCAGQGGASRRTARW